MSLSLPAAIALGSGLQTNLSAELSHMQTQREQLTSALRTLAAELDGLDRRLSDLEWRQRESHRERSALEAQRGQLSSRLRGLAGELSDIDTALALRKGHAPFTAPRVGTCPECGYPSLDSGLCAFCRPRLAY